MVYGFVVNLWFWFECEGILVGYCGRGRALGFDFMCKGYRIV